MPLLNDLHLAAEGGRCTGWDLRLSQWWCCRIFVSCVMWCCDIGHIVPHSLKVYISIIFVVMESVEHNSVWHIVILLMVMNYLSSDSMSYPRRVMFKCVCN